ncbi:ankyrin repeat domain-containing protein [Streptomyces xanthophaeus]
MGGRRDGGALIAAVQSGDVGRLHALLSAGADPNTVDEHGTPALCLAVDAFDLPIVEVLTASADLDRSGSAGRAPLLRAIELGAQDIVARFVDDGADLWATDSEGLDALALARYWHTTDAAAEVLRRSGRLGPVERRVVLSGWGTKPADR